MSTKQSVQEFLESGNYLPEFMRDFHDQKLLFKFVGSIVQNAKRKAKDKKGASDYLLEDMPNWMSASVYVVDFFLWTMARRGYTLQKSRKHIDDFRDINKDLAEYNRASFRRMADTIKAESDSARGKTNEQA